MSIERTYPAPDGGYGLTIRTSYHPNTVTVLVPGTGLEWTLSRDEFTDLVSDAVSHERMRKNASLPDPGGRVASQLEPGQDGAQ